MHSQTDSLFIHKNGEAAIIQCHCGIGGDHGQLEFMVTRDGDPGYLSVHMPPVWGYGHWNVFGWRPMGWYRLSTLFARIARAWDVLWGKGFDFDFSVSSGTCRDLGAWLSPVEVKGDRFFKVIEPTDPYCGKEGVWLDEKEGRVVLYLEGAVRSFAVSDLLPVSCYSIKAGDKIRVRPECLGPHGDPKGIGSVVRVKENGQLTVFYPDQLHPHFLFTDEVEKVND